MSFKKSLEELQNSIIASADFFDAEFFSVIWETKPEIIERLLPPPLEPTDRPIVRAYVSNFPKTNLGISYREAALSILCQYNNEPGFYFLAMHVDDDMAMAYGREVMGYPKKMATLHFEKNENKLNGWTERHGIRLFEIETTLMQKLSDEQSKEMGLGGYTGTGIVYLFKFFPAQTGQGFDYLPRLIKEEIAFQHQSVEVGEAKINFSPSEFDPWNELEVVNKLGAVYTIGKNSLLKGEVLTEIDSDSFMPHAFTKWDKCLTMR